MNKPEFEKLTFDKLVSLAKDIIWNNQGIDAFEIIMEIFHEGFDIEKDDHKRLFKALAKDPNIVQRNDYEFYMFKDVPVTMKTTSMKERKGCYGCPVLGRCDEYSDRVIPKSTEYVCLLDRRISINPKSCHTPSECPFNKAVRIMSEKKG